MHWRKIEYPDLSGIIADSSADINLTLLSRTHSVI